MPSLDSHDRGPFFKGVENMLINCAAAAPGDKVLIVHENAAEGYYDAEMLQDVVTASRQLGLFPALYEVAFNRDVTEPDPDLSAQISISDRTLFLARIGDQLRFNENCSPATQIVSYALDRDMLSSGFGTADYRAFDALKRLINTMMADADEIRVTCPLGTDFSGRLKDLDVEHGDTSIKRFPLSVFKPADANGFAGRIAQAGFLVGTGSNYYSPYACSLEDTLFVSFENNTITGFDGSPPMSPPRPRIMNKWAKPLELIPILCILGTAAFIRVAGLLMPPPKVLNGGVAGPLATRVSCISTPAAPIRRVKSR